MKTASREIIYKKYRAQLEKENLTVIDSPDYKPKHLFTVVHQEEKVINKPASEIVQKHKNFDLEITKRNTRVLTIKIIISTILILGAFVFAYFAFFYKF